VLRLTREVRFALSPTEPAKATEPAKPTLPTKALNSWSAHPPLIGLSHFLTVRLTVHGQLDRNSSYLLNIKTIDDAVRSTIPALAAAFPTATPASLLKVLHQDLPASLMPATLDLIELCLSPFLSYSLEPSSLPMLSIHQNYEFSAAHRLHNPALSDDANRALFGKCNNPAGHGHNYQLKVTLKGVPDSAGQLISISTLDELVNRTIIDHLDHKHLNLQVPEFASLNPSVENIAMVIYRRLAPHLDTPQAKLASITVWETPKTCAEYSE
jgi:6-pyruvoyltetrahydropterin/6-carboxytetrahydropterin synthase